MRILASTPHGTDLHGLGMRGIALMCQIERDARRAKLHVGVASAIALCERVSCCRLCAVHSTNSWALSSPLGADEPRRVRLVYEE